MTAQELFTAIEELRTHREAANRILASPYKDGELQLWLHKATALVQKVVPDEESYIVSAYNDARGRAFVSRPGYDARKINRDEAIQAKLPAIDEGLAAGNRWLTRLAGASTPSVEITPPVTQMPELTFTVVRDPKLRAIAVRDYRELRQAAYSGMTKAKAMLAGSVAEAVLFDALLRANVPAAELESLTMGGLYQRAVAERLLVGRSSNAVAASKDGRNFVHAGVEYGKGVLTSADADNLLTTMYVVLQELGIT